MGKWMFWFATAVVAAFLALLAYVIVTRQMPVTRRKGAPPPRRSATRPIRWVEKAPSGGLAWSKARYPEEYRPENLKTSKFVGRKLIDREEERYLDVAGRAYSRKVLEGFSYTDGKAARRPEVTVEYLAKAEAFAGRIRGTGLKPNFAYQLKLWGNYDQDAAGFERIGYTGRWRLPGRGTNYTDEAYERFPRKEEVEAYLLFDFFVTDDKGNVDKEFYADSSLHVLFNSSAQRSPGEADGCQVPVIRRGSDRSLYANPNVDLGMQRLYAESEQHKQGEKDHRKPIGRAFLPPGRYKAEVALTEESFHGYGDAGFWATVMTAPVEFEIVEKDRPKGREVWGSLVGEPLSAADAEVIDVDVSQRNEELLEGVATSDEPGIVFNERRHFDKGKRWVFCAEVLGEGAHTWGLFIDLGDGFERRPTYSFTTRGPRGWQRFEIEVTSMVAGRNARFRLEPSTRTGPIGVRNVSVCELLAPQPAPAAETAQRISEKGKVKNPMVIMETTKGTIRIELFEREAPKTVANFLQYVDERYYDGTIFHRVIPNFMAQGGGFTADYERKPTRSSITNEARSDLKNLRGTLAMARTSEVDSATSQFFINVKDNDFLDHRDETQGGFGYAVFGRVVGGMDIVDAIVGVKTGAAGPFREDAPIEPIVIKSVRRVEGTEND